MQELSLIFADRLALSLVNYEQVACLEFTHKESGRVIMDDETHKTVLHMWQERKKDLIVLSFLEEQIDFWLIPYVQALLLARYLRGDMDAYPPFFWN